MPVGRIDSAESAWRASLQEFGEQLRHKRENVLRLTQAQMAAWVGLDQSRISRIEAGGRPRDKAAALALAEAYRLTAAETKAWLELLFGSTMLLSTESVVGANSGWEVAEIYDLLETIHDHSDSQQTYNYFDSAPSGAFLRLAPSFNEAVNDAIDRLLQGQQRPLLRDHLLVEFAAILMHHLHRSGHHRMRLALALAGADAALQLERRTIEGWLRCDAIPWSLMERQNDFHKARSHLEHGLMLAKELKNSDMEAVALAFLAQASMSIGDNRRARNYLVRARRLTCAPAVQTRIEWIEGDLAMRQKHYDEAFAFYQVAEAIDIAQSGGPHTVVTPLFRLGDLYMRLLDLPAAKEVYLTLLGDMQPPLVSDRLARALFGLARVARLEGDVTGARRLAEEALAALATADDASHFRQIIALFVASLPA